jgi:cyanate lyase
MPSKSEVQHYARLLRHAIRAAGLTVTEVERRLGNGPKSLRRTFTGEVDLKFWHMISVLEVIGLSQEDFFAIAASGRWQPSAPAPPASGPPADHPELPAIEHFSADLYHRVFEGRASHAEGRAVIRHFFIGCPQCVAHMNRIFAEYRAGLAEREPFNLILEQLVFNQATGHGGLDSCAPVGPKAGMLLGLSDCNAIESEIQHYARMLRDAIRAAGLTVTEVERRLGNGPKSLRRVFTGEVDLKFKHVVSVLEVIGLSQEDFFAVAARGRRSRQQPSVGVEFLRALGHLEVVQTADDADDTGDALLDRMADETRRRLEVLEADDHADDALLDRAVDETRRRFLEEPA